MKLIPAVDLLEGGCVRLQQGDYGRVTRFDADPVELARAHGADGADALHLVDLDGAREGRGVNDAVIRDICAAVAIPVQGGGGVRDEDDVARLFDLGVHRVVVGTLAVERPDRVRGWMSRFGAERIVLALDVRLDESGDPRLATRGWRHQTERLLWELLEREFKEARHVLCTDIGRDGMLEGANADLYAEAVRRLPHVYWQASGGVSGEPDIRRLAAAGAAACILGRALLEGRLSVKGARRCLPGA